MNMLRRTVIWMVVITSLVVLATLGARSLALAKTKPQAVVPNMSGTGRPGLTGVGATIYVGWTGTDGGHLHIATTTDQNQTFQISNYSDTAPANEGPALQNYNGTVYVAWAGTNSAHTIFMGTFAGYNVPPALSQRALGCIVACTGTSGGRQYALSGLDWHQQRQ